MIDHEATVKTAKVVLNVDFPPKNNYNLGDESKIERF